MLLHSKSPTSSILMTHSVPIPVAQRRGGRKTGLIVPTVSTVTVDRMLIVFLDSVEQGKSAGLDFPLTGEH